jgi:hypothetical protein
MRQIEMATFMRWVVMLAMAMACYGQRLDRGPVLPGSCNKGDLFLLTSGADAVLHVCRSDNSWGQVTGSGGGGGGGAAAWGSITGTLASQADLAAALAGKSNWERQFVAAKCQNTIGGAAMSLPTANAPVAVCAASDVTNTTAWATLDWDDAGTKSAFDTVLLPRGSLGTIGVEIGVSTDTSATASVSMRLATACVAPGQAIDPAFNTPQTIAITPSTTAGRITQGTLASVTLTGCAAGQMMRFRIDRNTADASTATAKLHYVRFYVP